MRIGAGGIRLKKRVAMNTKRKLYLIPFEAQKAQIDVWCFGSCGRILFGAIDLGLCTGVPCRTDHCPHVDRDIDTGIERDGEWIVIRKLLPV